MLWINLFRDSGALLEPEPQGDASVPVDLPDHEEVLVGLIATSEASAALARLFLAGATVGERGARTMLPPAK